MYITQRDRHSTVKEISVYVHSGYAFLYLYTTEEGRTLKILEDVAKETETQIIYTYDIAKGMQCIYGEDRRLKYDKREDIHSAFEFITGCIENKSFVLFKDIHSMLQSDPKLVRTFKNTINEVLSKGIPVNIFIVSPVLHIPSEIDKEAIVIDIPLPSRNEIAEIFDKFTNRHHISVSGILKGKFIEALSGLTETEVHNILSYCYTEDAEFSDRDIDIIISQKQQLIKKGGVLEFVNIREKIDNIGGLKNLKEWLEKKKIIFDKAEKAREFGVDIPKGVLLFGMPGCGKSLSAKVIANYFEMPLLRLDMGMIMGPYVGQSEENIRKAIKLAESIAPSVLWIDEIEKVFVGVKGGGTGGSDVSIRIFSTILTWMQEKTQPVFVVATSNNITGMPPEFLRKGRFDEIFSVFFPKEEEIEEIFKVHLKKRKKEVWIGGIDFNKVIKKVKDFSGADIEAVVKEVIEEAFINNKQEISTDDFLIKIEGFKPLSETMKDEITELKKTILKIDCKNAS